ncbi:MAG: hypothetical protein ACXWKC_08170 [Xanthobacteraceae bacterium]
MNAHHSSSGLASERVADAVSVPNTALQAGLNLERFVFRQATIRSTLGISELHSRNTSGVHACRCASVPAAKHVTVDAANAKATNAARDGAKKPAAKIVALFGLFFTAISSALNCFTDTIIGQKHFKPSYFSSESARPGL